MMIDSLFQKRSQNLPIYLQMSPPPTEMKIGNMAKNSYGRFGMT